MLSVKDYKSESPIEFMTLDMIDVNDTFMFIDQLSPENFDINQTELFIKLNSVSGMVKKAIKGRCLVHSLTSGETYLETTTHKVVMIPTSLTMHPEQYTTIMMKMSKGLGNDR